jgi:hypothetical protein
MSEKERHLLVIMEQVQEAYKSLKLAARHMKLCYRQAKRVWRRFRMQGEGGLVHCGRGEALNQRISSARCEAILGRYRQRYEGLGLTLAAEKLSEKHLGVNAEMLRLWLLHEELRERHRQRSTYRRLREPRG